MSGRSEVGILDDAQKIRADICRAIQAGDMKDAQSALADLRKIAGTSVVLSDRGRTVLQGHLRAAEAHFRRKTGGSHHCR